MDLDPIDEGEIQPPPPASLRRYLSLDPPRTFTVRGLEDELGSSNKARQFGTKATDKGLAVRVERGGYVAVDPSVAIRSWALGSYYADLLVIHDALDHLGVDHAFACLTAGEHTGLVLDRPWVVIPPEAKAQVPKLEVFTYGYGTTGTRRLEALGETFELPTLSSQETALILAATGLPREVEAASSLLEDRSPHEDLAASFNYVGLDVASDTVAVEDPEITFPAFIEQRRDSLSDELLRGGRS